MSDFSTIAAAANMAGIERCITSFLDFYPKIKRRVKKMNGFAFHDPPLEKKIDILYQLHNTLAPYGIKLQMCCEKDLLEKLPSNLTIKASSCVPNKLLAELYGEGLSMRKDPGQRIKAGCGCGVSVDIGSYREHPCRHGCLYCYASPTDYRIPEDRATETCKPESRTSEDGKRMYRKE